MKACISSRWNRGIMRMTAALQSLFSAAIKKS